MIKDITRYIPLTTIIISYFFLCGGLYLYGFWSTFNIDISNLINITDIPKSFIFPFVAYTSFYFLHLTINIFTILPSKEKDDDENKEEDKLIEKYAESGKKIIFIKLLLRRIFLSIEGVTVLVFVVLVMLYEKFKMMPLFWLISSLSLAFLFSFRLKKNTVIKQAIPNSDLRKYIIHALLFIPIFSFGLGRINSLSIYNNSDKHYIKMSGSSNSDKDSGTDTLKFIGFVGDKLIVASLDNKRIIYINQSSFDQLIVENQTETTTAK